MASRTISLSDRADLSAPPGSSAWAAAMRLEIAGLLSDNESSAEHLRIMVAAIKQHEGYRKLEGPDGEPFTTYEAFCIAPSPWGLGYDPNVIQRIVEERESAQARAMQAQPLRKRGRPSKDDKTLPGNVLSQGNSSDYLAARIARDHKDIHERMKAGEFPTVKAAARAVGIIKKTVSHQNTPEAFARAARRHLSESDIERMIEILEAAE